MTLGTGIYLGSTEATKSRTKAFVYESGVSKNIFEDGKMGKRHLCDTSTEGVPTPINRQQITRNQGTTRQLLHY